MHHVKSRKLKVCTGTLIHQKWGHGVILLKNLQSRNSRWEAYTNNIWPFQRNKPFSTASASIIRPGVDPLNRWICKACRCCVGQRMDLRGLWFREVNIGREGGVGFFRKELVGKQKKNHGKVGEGLRDLYFLNIFPDLLVDICVFFLLLFKILCGWKAGRCLKKLVAQKARLLERCW